MQRILLMAFLLLAMMVCVTTPAGAGGVENAQAGRKALEAGNFDQAIGLYTKAIASGQLPREQLSEAYAYRGLAWGNKGNNDKAIADLTKAIEINPRNAEAYAFRAIIWKRKGNDAQAKADYEKAIELDPDLEEAF